MSSATRVSRSVCSVNSRSSSPRPPSVTCTGASCAISRSRDSTSSTTCSARSSATSRRRSTVDGHQTGLAVGGAQLGRRHRVRVDHPRHLGPGLQVRPGAGHGALHGRVRDGGSVDDAEDALAVR